MEKRVRATVNSTGILNEKVNSLRSSRSGHIVIITKIINRLSLLLTEQNKDSEIVNMSNKLNETLGIVEKITFEHNNLVSTEESEAANQLLMEQKIKVDQIKSVCEEYFKHSNADNLEIDNAISQDSRHHSSSHRPQSTSSLNLLLRRKTESDEAQLKAKLAEEKLKTELNLLERKREIELKILEQKRDEIVERLNVVKDKAEIARLRESRTCCFRRYVP